MTTPKDSDLLPCPFCGSPAEFGEHSAYSTDSSFDCIRCTNNACGALMYEHHAPSWNRRAMPLQDHNPSMLAVLKAVEQRLNESGTGEMGLLDTIHAVYALIKPAILAEEATKS